jgi:hypothetical protein
MADITVEVWLYGALSRYGGKGQEPSFAHLEVTLPGGAVLEDLLSHLEMPTEERGITFINGRLSAMPGLQPDLDEALQGGDRVGFFDPKSMWPFQYRHGAATTESFSKALSEQGLHHTYGRPEAPADDCA